MPSVFLPLLLPAIAGAQDVLHHTSPWWVRLHPDAIQALSDAGSTGVLETDTMPESLSDYALVILSGPPTTNPPLYTPDQVDQLRSVVNRGGWLLVMGENEENFAGFNSVLNVLLTDLGSTMQIQDASLDRICGHVGTLVEPSHPLLEGMSSISYGYSSTVIPGRGTALAELAGSETFLAVEGQIVVTGDANIASYECDLAPDNERFLQNLYRLATRPCTDDDGDGYAGPGCGPDCRDDDDTIHPGVVDPPYDGVDQDCDGRSDYDADQDGHDSDVYGGDDCDDQDAAISPSTAETWYDGIDQDCDGTSDYDQDRDGHDSDVYGGDDCLDTDPMVSPDAEEIWYDDVDSDCDGWSDFDQDRDGYDSDEYGGGDCDDLDPLFSPGVQEIWYDGIDQNCDGAPDYDQDGDGHDSDAHGGDDCDDLSPDVHPGAEDAWYDGIDSDCDGRPDFDADGDGYDSDAHGGEDCDDSNAEISPEAHDYFDDGIDQDCDGSDDSVASVSGEGVGCGCTAGSTGAAGPSLVLLGLVVLGLRRTGGISEPRRPQNGAPTPKPSSKAIV